MEKLSKDKKIICFGGGNNLTYVFDAVRDLRLEERVSYIADNDSRKWGKDRILNGRRVRMENPEKLRTEDWGTNILLVTIVSYQTAVLQLEDLLQGTGAVCLLSPFYRYWYDKIIDKITLKQPMRNVIVLQGEGDTCENAKALMQAFRKQKTYAI